jgi:hypothetical protein
MSKAQIRHSTCVLYQPYISLSVQTHRGVLEAEFFLFVTIGFHRRLRALRAAFDFILRWGFERYHGIIIRATAWASFRGVLVYKSVWCFFWFF